MTPLKKRLIQQIKIHGPLTISQYFTQCLLDPKNGYYTTNDPFGEDGDFITAPEISQMFGELIAVWVYKNWQAMGSPSHFSLCECGPGKGSLMSDILRTLKTIGNGACFQALNVILLEASQRLRDHQDKTLAPFAKSIQWVDSLQKLEPSPTLFIANEFFDALPFSQYVKLGETWCERMVGLSADQTQLCFQAGAGSLDTSLLPDAANAREGEIVEMAPARSAWMDNLSYHIAQFGGAGLIIDYGYFEPVFGDSLQALRHHKFDDVLNQPGKADLTSHVDFHALEQSATINGLSAQKSTQSQFLLALGLLERAGQLGYNKDEDTQRVLKAQVERLASDDQMGKLFKVLSVGKDGHHWYPKIDLN